MWTDQDDTRVRAGQWTAGTVVTWFIAACGPSLAPLPPPQAPAPSEVLAPTPAATAPPNVADLLRARHLMVPVDGVGVERLMDSYAAERAGARRHSAIDINAPRGTAVVAADDGSVLRMGYNALGGLTIYQVDPQRTFVYYYAHLDRYASTLREGGVVSRGDVIGYVGSSGNASPNAPHLHFQVLVYRERYWEGESVNPFGAFEFPGKRR